MDLSKLTDSQLALKIKKNNSSELYLELKKRTEKCYYKTCSSYVRKCNQLNYNELVEDCDLVINRSIQTFNPKKKTKFSSWLTSMSRFHVLNTIKSKVELNHFIPTELKDLDTLNNSNNSFTAPHNDDLKKHVFTLLDKIGDERIKIIFEDRFYGDKQGRKWKQIAEKLKLTTQQISNIYKSAREKIYKEMIKEEV
jgi:RNA polymerase sigma factor (sigma-70 family)